MLKRYWPFLLWLVYFVSPVDILPDILVGPGFVDDLLFLIVLYWFLNRRSSSYRSSRAERSSYPGSDSEEKAKIPGYPTGL